MHGARLHGGPAGYHPDIKGEERDKGKATWDKCGRGEEDVGYVERATWRGP